MAKQLIATSLSPSGGGSSSFLAGQMSPSLHPEKSEAVIPGPDEQTQTVSWCDANPTRVKAASIMQTYDLDIISHLENQWIWIFCLLLDPFSFPHWSRQLWGVVPRTRFMDAWLPGCSRFFRGGESEESLALDGHYWTCSFHMHFTVFLLLRACVVMFTHMAWFLQDESWESGKVNEAFCETYLHIKK